MSELDASRRSDGTVVIAAIPAILAGVLREVPELLAGDQPDAVRRRLFPVPGDDEEAAREWRAKQHPELFALLASAREVVAKDLAGLRRAAGRRTYRIEIPEAHVNAWISALNAARLAMGAAHSITAEDMQLDRELPADDRGRAVIRIDLLAWLQQALIHAVAPETDDR